MTQGDRQQTALVERGRCLGFQDNSQQQMRGDWVGAFQTTVSGCSERAFIKAFTRLRFQDNRVQQWRGDFIRAFGITDSCSGEGTSFRPFETTVSSIGWSLHEGRRDFILSVIAFSHIFLFHMCLTINCRYPCILT